MDEDRERVLPVDTVERTVIDGRDVVVLYRPVGPAELKLVEESGMTRWPPRLEEQPIFYPVTNRRYAREIASRWNVPADGAAYVTRFHVLAERAARYPVQVVGASHHAELWVPAEELESMNDAIVGPIVVVETLDRDAHES